ncbi:hypothetical protein [Teredinibacter haidensis]|uniref:hypothetical protein n=1 Tax=Teredinibacter haidensis TaxID=2731755 RepID=UPI0009490BB6|nr:hypothetical protein [Teredinibacter haidensis]
MLSESVSTFLSMFSPKKSPYYAVILSCVVTLVSTKSAVPEISSYVVVLAFPVLILFCLLSYLIENKTDAEDSPYQLVYARTIGISAGFISLIILIQLTHTGESTKGVELLGERFNHIYTAILVHIVYYLTLSLWNRSNQHIHNCTNMTQITLVISVFLISSTFLGVSKGSPKTLSIYYNFLSLLFWVNLFAFSVYLRKNHLKTFFEKIKYQRYSKK